MDIEANVCLSSLSAETGEQTVEIPIESQLAAIPAHQKRSSTALKPSSKTTPKSNSSPNFLDSILSSIENSSPSPIPNTPLAQSGQPKPYPVQQLHYSTLSREEHLKFLQLEMLKKTNVRPAFYLPWIISDPNTKIDINGLLSHTGFVDG